MKEAHLCVYFKKHDIENANKEKDQFEYEIKRQMVNIYNVTSEVNQRILYDELSADDSRINLYLDLH